MKKMANVLFIVLISLLAITYYYRLPYIKRFMGDRGLVIVYHVAHRSDLEAEIVIVTRVDKRVVVEVIKGPGPENVIAFRGEAAKRYLIDAGLD